MNYFLFMLDASISDDILHVSDEERNDERGKGRTMASRIKYETETCGRCGGSGHYSRCQMYGTTCFKCAGQKRVVSKAGKKASAAVQEFIKENFSIPVEAVEIGMRILHDGKPFVVKGVSSHDLSSSLVKDENGAYVMKNYTTINLESDRLTWGMAKGSLVQFTLTPEKWAQVIAFARTIKKGLTIIEAETAVTAV